MTITLAQIPDAARHLLSDKPLRRPNRTRPMPKLRKVTFNFDERDLVPIEKLIAQGRVNGEFHACFPRPKLDPHADLRDFYAAQGSAALKAGWNDPDLDAYAK